MISLIHDLGSYLLVCAQLSKPGCRWLPLILPSFCRFPLCFLWCSWRSTTLRNNILGRGKCPRISQHINPWFFKCYGIFCQHGCHFSSFMLANYSGSWFSCVSVPVKAESIFFCDISQENWCKTEHQLKFFQRGNSSFILPLSSGEFLHTAEGFGWIDTHGCASLKHLMQIASLTHKQKKKYF